jgi:hypothetical protein
MTQLTDKQILLQIKRESVGGLKLGASGKKITPEPLSKPMETEMPKARFSEEEMLVLENYAKYLPRGNRKLSLNIKELTDALLSRIEIAAPLTKTSGLNRGGKLSLTTEKPPKSQNEYLATIQNKNNLKTNPNFAGFKNDFKI